MYERTLTATSLNKKSDNQSAELALVQSWVVDASSALLDDLPRIKPEVLESENAIFRSDRRISFEWSDGSSSTVVLLTTPISGATHCPAANQSANVVIYQKQQDHAVNEVYRLHEGQSDKLVIDARFGPHNVSICLTSIAFLELLDGANAALLPAQFKCALVESYLENAVWRLEQTGGLLISISDIRFNPKELPNRGYNLFFEIYREKGLSACTGYLSLDLQGLGRFAAILKNQDHPLAWDRIDHLSIPLRFVLGSTRLSLSEINSLAVDDLVLLDGISCQSSQGPLIRVDLAGKPFWLAKEADNQLVVEKKMEHTMEDNVTEDVWENEDVSDLEQIELELVFELGRKSMSLAEIRRIGPGYIFDLDGESLKSVSVYLNGNRIGSGELVKIDSRLGMRLTHYLQRRQRNDH